MTITLSGENHYLLQRSLRQLVAAFVQEHGDLALEQLDGEEAAMPQVHQALTSLPFLASKKMVVLRAPNKITGFADVVEQLLSEVPETTEVIIVEPKLDKRLSYYKYLVSKTDFRSFAELNSAELSSWLVQQAKQQGASLSQADARYLVERVGATQQLLAGELDKLALYDAAITKQTIDLLTDAAPQSTIFELIEAAFAGRTGLALDLYREQRTLRVEPQQIIALLTWQLNVLALLKFAGTRTLEQIAREAKLNPYVVKKSQATAQKLAISNLRSRISDLLDIDKRSKRTNLDLDEALQLYILKLAH